MQSNSKKPYICRCGFFILIMMVILSFTAKSSAQAAGNTKIIKKNSDFNVSAEYGLDGMVVYDNPMQAVVKIESKQNFTGTLQVMGEGDSGQVITAYGRSISLAAGESKTYSLTVSAPASAGVVYLSLLDERNKTVYKEKTTLELTGIGEFAMVGVLADDYSGLSYMNGASVAMGTGDFRTVSTLELTKDSFPEDPQVLSMLSCVVIDNFDTSALSDKQYEALKQWVSDGGVLILSLGSHYQNVLAGFKDDFVSGELNTLSKKNMKWNILGEELTLDGVECMDFTLQDGKELSGFGNEGTAYEKNYGMGNVVVLAYSLSMEPFAGYVRNNSVAAGLFENVANLDMSGSQGDYNALSNTGTRLTDLAESTRHPSAILYGVLLALYVVFVGPVLYLILKKMKNQEKIWIAIPITALVFTGIIYCTSFLYRVNKPLLDTFSIIQMTGDSAKENVYSKVICPSAKRYEFDLSEKYSGFRTDYNQYDYSLFGNDGGSKEGGYDYMFLDTGVGSRVILNSDSAFDTFDFSVSRVIPEGIGRIDCDLDCQTTGFSGTITNNTAYDLTDVVVTYENYFYIAGDIKQGMTLNIDKSKIINAATYGGYGVFDALYSYSGSNRLQYQLYQINSAIESNLIDISKYNHGYVWGTILSYKTDLTDDKQVKNSGMAVVMDSFNQDYSDMSGNYYNSIEPMAVNYQGDYDSGTGQLYTDEVRVTYSFEGYGDIDTLTFNDDNASINGGNINNVQYASVEAFNMDTGDYEPVFVDSDTLTGAELAHYLSHNIIKLRYIGQNDDSSGIYIEYHVPRISAEGGD